VGEVFDPEALELLSMERADHLAAKPLCSSPRALPESSRQTHRHFQSWQKEATNEFAVVTE
jgi:hypothetical protein